MGRCLTPTGWSPHVERREAPFQATTPEGWRDEIFERIAVWEAWVFELGGAIFVERSMSAPAIVHATTDKTKRGVDLRAVHASLLVSNAKVRRRACEILDATRTLLESCARTRAR